MYMRETEATEDLVYVCSHHSLHLPLSLSLSHFCQYLPIQPFLYLYSSSLSHSVLFLLLFSPLHCITLSNGNKVGVGGAVTRTPLNVPAVIHFNTKVEILLINWHYSA